MATPKPGEIRCPTCHRSTPPAAFCTQCGSAIPPDARIRPRGLDREELQERIRARRSGGDPYRRGAAAGLAGGEYERFEPDPADTAVRSGPAASERRRDLFDEHAAVPPHSAPHSAGDARRDLTRERDDWGVPTPLPPPGAGRPTPLPTHAPVHDESTATDDARYAGADDAAHYDEPVYDEAAYAGTAYDQEGYPYDPDEWDDRRHGGAGAFAILGFLALGVLALIGGAVLAGVFSGEPQTGAIGTTPTPTLDAAPTATDAATAEPTTAGPPAPALTAEPRQTGEPVVFPDGFTAEVQPCIPGSADLDGCDSNGAVNGGAVDIWVGFENGTENDVIGVTVLGPDGQPTDAGSMDLTRIGCVPDCRGGWTYFPISGLAPGTYDVEITRNGQPAGETSFEVS